MRTFSDLQFTVLQSTRLVLLYILAAIGGNVHKHNLYDNLGCILYYICTVLVLVRCIQSWCHQTNTVFWTVIEVNWMFDTFAFLKNIFLKYISLTDMKILIFMFISKHNENKTIAHPLPLARSLQKIIFGLISNNKNQTLPPPPWYAPDINIFVLNISY